MFLKLENNPELRRQFFGVREFYIYTSADEEAPVKKIFNRIVERHLSELDEESSGY